MCEILNLWSIYFIFFEQNRKKVFQNISSCFQNRRKNTTNWAKIRQLIVIKTKIILNVDVEWAEGRVPFLQSFSPGTIAALVCLARIARHLAK